MFAAPAPVSEPVRPAAPVAEAYQDQTPVPPPAPAPQRVYTTPPRTFQEISQHDEVAEAPQRPQRRRKHHDAQDLPQEAAPQQTALQLVETQVDVPPPAVMEDELPRRTRPRRRRGQSTGSEPLQMVETDPAAARNPDNAPAP
jgi:hypothetical protein